MKQAQRENWEGLMVKLVASPYRTGKRSPEWMKFKLNKQDEFVVVRLDAIPAARACTSDR